jgi:hypothetical protein
MNNKHVLTNHHGDEKEIEIFVAKSNVALSH